MKKLHIETGETDTYGFEWAVRLPAGDSLTESSWSDVEGLETEDGSYSGTITAITITAPDEPGEFILRNTVTTSGELTLHADFLLVVGD